MNKARATVTGPPMTILPGWMLYGARLLNFGKVPTGIFIHRHDDTTARVTVYAKDKSERSGNIWVFDGAVYVRPD